MRPGGTGRGGEGGGGAPIGIASGSVISWPDATAHPDCSHFSRFFRRVPMRAWSASRTRSRRSSANAASYRSCRTRASASASALSRNKSSLRRRFMRESKRVSGREAEWGDEAAQC